MVVGKLLILLSSPVSAQTITDPQFFNYNSNNFTNRLIEFSFGWFRKLSDEENAAHNQGIQHALLYAENGEAVSWFTGKASGYSKPVVTWPTGSGYCRRLHVQAVAYGIEKAMSATACYSNAHDNWTWVSDK